MDPLAGVTSGASRYVFDDYGARFSRAQLADAPLHTASAPLDAVTESQPLSSPAALNAAEMQLVRDEVRPWATFAAAVYEQENVAGFERVRESELGAELSDSLSGFKAAVYRQGDQVVVAFAGTDGIRPLAGDFQGAADWVTNVRQAWSVPSQYRSAVAVVRAAQRLGSDVTVVGHSLGGGLATYAALRTGARAYAFNAAGLGLAARTQLWLRGQLSNASERVTNVNVRSEILSSDSIVPGLGMAPAQLGRVYEVSPRVAPAAIHMPFVRPIGPALFQVLAAGADLGMQMWDRTAARVQLHGMEAVQSALDGNTTIERVR